MNSEPIFNRVLWSYLQSCGAKISYDETCMRFTGKNRIAVEAYLRQVGLPIPVSWPEVFYRDALVALAAEATAIDGVERLLDILSAQGVAVCVASNGLMEKMQVTLGRVGFLPQFQDAMFSAYDIGEAKPAPDVFLHAARTMGVMPKNCRVIEDSSSGFEAAQRAGMRCFAYLPHPNARPKQTFSAVPFETMQELPALLGL